MRQERSNGKLYVYGEWLFFLECGAYHNLSILGTDRAYAKFHAAVIGCQGKNS